MPTLATDLRRKLERVVIEARDTAEAGARAALEALAVHHHEPYRHMKPAQRALRNHLRARARQLGDRQDKSGRLAIDHLVNECAYEHWHRMLFARFLAENNLLIEPREKMPISLAEAEELAADAGVDVWVYASRCAQEMLPQIFRPDDPLLAVAFAREHRVRLESLLASLPSAVFTASDALGWCYQFWQSKRKDQVNRSEVKIGADELPAVTQLFTEPYMVQFLLHNTLGAWWAGKRLTAEDAENAETEEELRRKVALPGVNWEYLRFVKTESTAEDAEDRGGRKPDSESPPRSSAPSAVKSSWRPAAGTFDGWPKAAKEIKVLDPCCGSGHFLVAALHHLVPIRMAEEGLSAAEAVDAVLRDNLHGLEIDERCCQIAAFALALAAWTFTAEDAEGRREQPGYRELPELNIACSGIGPQCTADEWIKLAEQSGVPMPAVGREAIKNGLLNLHRLFSQAPTLGSLINPAELPADLIAADYETIQPYLAAILKAEKADDETRERAIAAAGMVKAADLLAGEYTLVITNVPYLGRGRQDDPLKARLEKQYKEGKADLASAFVMRCLDLCDSGGTASMVTPQSWLFLTSYKALRETMLKRQEWNVVARLGPGAFEGIGGHVVNVALPLISAKKPRDTHIMAGIDVSFAKEPAEKANLLRGDSSSLINLIPQAEQLKNPDATITFTVSTIRSYLYEYAGCYQGLTTADDGKWRRQFWEVPSLGGSWLPLQTPSQDRGLFAGREDVVARALVETDDHTGVIRGREAWGKLGVAIDRVGSLARTMYEGDLFHSLVPVVVAHKKENHRAVAAFCLSGDFISTARESNQSLSIDNGYLSKIPFDLAHWQKIAAEKYPDGLPEPESDDPTQWLFHGWPVVNLPAAGKEALQPLAEREAAIATLQVAVVRLLGYRWPAELDEKMRLSKRARALVAKCGELAELADNDGIVCIPAVRGEEPAAERLRRLLAAAFGEKWSAELEQKLIRATGSTAADLDEWLRNDFFEQHCKLFHDRPFIWHIWDGRKRDGFHALVNYHKLCGAGLTAAGAEGRRDKHPEKPPRSSASSAVSSAGRRLLESLTYAYLGEWITRQRDGVKRGEGGAEDRLAAALELQKRLEAILEGEPPFDIFVRWKKLSEQPIGWEPDINDGVRMNIRPFMASDLPGGRTGAGILRYRPNIRWTKDRGKEPKRPKDEYPWFWGWDEKTEDFAGGKTFDGNRWNDCHYTNKVKQAARERLTAEGAEGRGGKR